jgi:hypothetical protein
VHSEHFFVVLLEIVDFLFEKGGLLIGSLNRRGELVTQRVQLGLVGVLEFLNLAIIECYESFLLIIDVRLEILQLIIELFDVILALLLSHARTQRERVEGKCIRKLASQVALSQKIKLTQLDPVLKLLYLRKEDAAIS